MPEHPDDGNTAAGNTAADSAAAVGTAAVGFAIDPALRRLVLTVTLGAIMAILDTTIVAVAIEALGQEFDTSLSTISWVTTGYLLALAVVIPLTGWAVERFGATRMWNISLVLFLAGSALCGAAWSAESLIVFRILQGLGGGMIMPICMTLVARAAGPQRMNRVMNIIGIPSLVAPILGPVIGGLLVDNLDWRWIFFVNLPIGAVALVASWRVLPQSDRGQSHHRLDVPGLLLISPGLAALVYGLSQAGSNGGFGSLDVQISIAVGAVALAGFVAHALRRADALLDLRLFRNRTFTFTGLATFMIGATLFGGMFLLPLYYQIARGQSALAAGLSLVPQGLGAMVAMPLASRMADRRGPGWVVPIGMTVSMLGTLAFTQVDAHTSEVALAACLFVRGLGFGAAMMPAMSAAYQTLTPAAVPRATTTLNILQRVGGSLATALVAVELQHALSDRLPEAGGGALESSQRSDLPPAIADQLGEAFASTFWWVLALTAVGLLASLFLPRHPPASAPGGARATGPAPAQLPAPAEPPTPVVDTLPAGKPALAADQVPAVPADPPVPATTETAAATDTSGKGEAVALSEAAGRSRAGVGSPTAGGSLAVSESPTAGGSLAKAVSEAVSESLAEAEIVATAVSESLTKAVAVSESLTKAVAEPVSNAMGKAVADAVSKVVAEAVHEAVSKVVAEAVNQAVSESLAKAVSAAVDESLTRVAGGRLSQPRA